MPILCNPMGWHARLPCPSLSPGVCFQIQTGVAGRVQIQVLLVLFTILQEIQVRDKTLRPMWKVQNQDSGCELTNRNGVTLSLNSSRTDSISPCRDDERQSVSSKTQEVLKHIRKNYCNETKICWIPTISVFIYRHHLYLHSFNIF